MIREAAALILLRDSSNGLEVCMLRRVKTSGFAAGAYVFPGGAVDESDHGLSTTNACFFEQQTDSKLLACKVAALRETLEEAGILAANVNTTAMINSSSRHKLHDGKLSFQMLLAEHAASLDLDNVIFYDHWITPDGAPKRFDTRFFLTKALLDHDIVHDNKETDSSCWALPEDILSLYDQGKVKLMPVTHVQLKRLSKFNTSDEALAFAKNQGNIPVTEPIMNWGDQGKPVSVTINLAEGEVEYPVFQKRA